LLKIVITCERCKQQIEVSLNENLKFTSACSKCSTAFALMWRPELIHSASDIMGYIDKEGCALFDLLPGGWKISCFQCGEENIDKKMAFGQSFNQLNCQQCFTQIHFTIERVEFIRVRVATTVPDIELNHKKVTKIKDESASKLGIVKGKPLPNTGVCKHYKRSKRWLRFPCCGRLFPCETCHNEATDHEGEWAKKMLCGFCSTEQSASNLECKSCGGDVTGSRHSAFWEGGTGQRDQSKMNRNESKKFAGQNKTISNKAKGL